MTIVLLTLIDWLVMRPILQVWEDFSVAELPTHLYLTLMYFKYINADNTSLQHSTKKAC